MNMKTALLVAGLGTLAATAIPSIASASTKADAAELVAMWEPTDVRVEGKRLTIVLPQRRITEEIYMSVLTAGLCLGPLVDKPLHGVSEIRILNQFGEQGYVYEKGLEDCAAFNDRPVGDAMTKIEILGATHLH